MTFGVTAAVDGAVFPCVVTAVADFVVTGICVISFLVVAPTVGTVPETTCTMAVLLVDTVTGTDVMAVAVLFDAVLTLSTSSEQTL